ncbi:MAG TPA: hypothetical protein VNL98_12205, partial [Gemmatimonadales bacterium]|nr:hypothetical protein [Gemmatimonadales bacterium]
EDALDDRGRIWLRYGPPEQRFVHSTDAETWCYERPEGRLRVTFIRRTGGWGLSGDVVVAPVLSSEVPSARYLLSTDRPSLEATLSFSFWPATFRSVTGRGTDLYLFPDSVSATAVLLDSRGREAARDTATARALRATVAGGLYHLLVDAERGGQLGRYRGAIAVPDYHHDSLAVSSLLLAPGQVAASRSAMVAAAPAGLRLPARTPLRVYGEIYGLGRTEGMARYEVRYSFEPLRGRFHGLGPRPRTTVITFVREVAHAAEIVESVVIDPGRLPPGRYRLTVQVNDLARRATATTAAVHFDLR